MAISLAVPRRTRTRKGPRPAFLPAGASRGPGCAGLSFVHGRCSTARHLPFPTGIQKTPVRRVCRRGPHGPGSSRQSQPKPSVCDINRNPCRRRCQPAGDVATSISTDGYATIQRIRKRLPVPSLSSEDPFPSWWRISPFSTSIPPGTLDAKAPPGVMPGGAFSGPESFAGHRAARRLRMRRRGHGSRHATTGTTLPSKMRIFWPSNFVSSKNASSSLKPRLISCSRPMAMASPKGSDSV